MSILDAAFSLNYGSAFRGADWNRLSMDRISSANHPDTEVRPSARMLRARARDLVRNNPYATGVVDAFKDNIIGEHGIRLKPQITKPVNDPAGELVKDVNWRIERAWEDWGDEHAAVDGFDSWMELERLIIGTWVTDGEVFVRRRRGWDNPFGFAVEVIDADLLDESFNVPASRNGGNEIVMGVEMDGYGRRTRYWFWDRHPDEPGRKRIPVPAAEVSHFFVRHRSGQTRGYSLFAPVLTTVEMIDGYSEAELVAARIAASQMGFITNNHPDAMQAYATRLSAQNQQGKDPQPKIFASSPGTHRELLPFQDFKQFDPTHPADAFDPFLKVLLRGVAKGFSISYHTLTADVTDASYSSQRVGLVPERDHWRVLQRVAAHRVHRPVYRDWVGMSLLTGALKGLPSSVGSDYYRVQWRGRRWQWIDPLNDVQTFEREVKLGINSRTLGASDRGRDYETVVDEIADEQTYARDAGVFVGGTDSPPPVAAKPIPNGNGNGNGNGGPPTNRLELAPYPEGR